MIIFNLESLNNISYKDFSLIETNYDNFVLEYKNSNFVIDPDLEFKNCKVYEENDIYKIKINLDENNDKHKSFISGIVSLYNAISDIFNKNETLSYNVRKPIYGKNKIKIFYVNLSKTTYIENIKTNDNLKIKHINYNKIDIYPIFCNPILKISNNVIYINFYFHSIFINFLKEQKLNVDYKKIKEIMNIND
jgi:hypothetical protein